MNRRVNVQRGTFSDDTLTGNPTEPNILIGCAGDDVVTAGGARDTLFGNRGDDHLFGEAGNDLIVGGSGDDTLNGGAGFDELYGGAGDDTAHGGAGDDIFFASAGHDRFDGGTGHDTYDASGLAGFTGRFSFGFGGQIFKGDNFGRDVIGDFDAGGFIEPVESILAPLGRDDNLVDLSPNAFVSSSEEQAAAAVDLDAGAIELFLGELDGERLFGVDIENFDDIVGTANGDTLKGNDDDNRIVARAGDDTLVGTAGDDELDGGPGFDTADYRDLGAPITFAQAGIVRKGVTNLFDTDGALGQDQLGVDSPFDFIEKVIGASGFANNLDTSGGSNISVEVDLAAENITAIVKQDIAGIPGIIDGIAAMTSFSVDIVNFVNVIGTDDFGDDLFGDGHANTIIGGGGDDLIRGRDGDDTLRGDKGDDLIFTGAGMDTVVLYESDGTDQVQDFDHHDDTLFFNIAGLDKAQLSFADTGSALRIAASDFDVAVDLVGFSMSDRCQVDLLFGDGTMMA